MGNRRFRIHPAAIVAALAIVTLSVASNVGVARAASSGICVRVVHASSSAGAVDMYFAGRAKPFPTNFSFGEVSKYWPEQAGPLKVVVTPAGQPQSAALLTTSVNTTEGNTYYTLALLGEPGQPLSLLTIKDDNSIASGQAKVRVYHLSPDAGLASLTLGGQTVATLDNQQTSDYLKLQPGDYSFELTMQRSGKTVPVSVTLPADKVTSVFAVGSVNSSGANAFKFVVVSTVPLPGGWPATGVDPRPAAARAAPWWLARLIALNG